MILFVVPEQEFNIGDQLLIERGLAEREPASILIKHVTWLDICRRCSLDSFGVLFLCV
jgi:hypothetical protein